MNNLAIGPAVRSAGKVRARPNASHFIMATLLIVFGFYILYPVILVFINSFNTASIGQPTEWVAG